MGGPKKGSGRTSDRSDRRSDRDRDHDRERRRDGDRRADRSSGRHQDRRIDEGPARDERSRRGSASYREPERRREDAGRRSSGQQGQSTGARRDSLAPQHEYVEDGVTYEVYDLTGRYRAPRSGPSDGVDGSQAAPPMSPRDVPRPTTEFDLEAQQYPWQIDAIATARVSSVRRRRTQKENQEALAFIHGRQAGREEARAATRAASEEADRQYAEEEAAREAARERAQTLRRELQAQNSPVPDPIRSSAAPVRSESWEMERAAGRESLRRAVRDLQKGDKKDQEKK